MPNWKKLVVSGSDASLNSLTTPNNIVNQLTASYAINAVTTAINSGTVIHIDTPSTTWDLVHNVNEFYPIVTIWSDTTNRVIQPNEIESIDLNTVRVTFAVPVSGYANISRAGHVVSGSTLWTNLVGPANITASINLSGSIIADSGFTGSFTGSITGSLEGTSSYALNASSSISASYALTASYSPNLQISGSITSVNYIDFNTGSATPPYKSGRVFWDNTEGALSIYNAESDVTLQVGQENWTRVFNDTGVTIPNGTPVRITGTHGDHPKIVLAQSIQVSGSSNLVNQVLGLTTHAIEDGTYGYVTTQGLVRGINTSAYTDGDTLYISSSAGKMTSAVPDAPYEIIPIGQVVKASPGESGIIYVAVQQPLDFTDLSSVYLGGGTYTDGDLWTYNGPQKRWEHKKQLSGSYEITGSLQATSFTGSLLGTSSYALTASYLSTSTSYRTSISGSSSYVVTHNLGEKYVIAQAYDSNDSQVIPNSITLIDSSSLNIGFPSIFIGNIVISR